MEEVWRARWPQVHLVLLWRWAAGRDGAEPGLLLLLLHQLGRVSTHAGQRMWGRLAKLRLRMWVWVQVRRVLCAPRQRCLCCTEEAAAGRLGPGGLLR